MLTLCNTAFLVTGAQKLHCIMVPYTWRNTLEVVLVLDNDGEIIILGGIENAGLDD